MWFRLLDSCLGSGLIHVHIDVSLAGIGFTSCKQRSERTYTEYEILWSPFTHKRNVKDNGRSSFTAYATPTSPLRSLHSDAFRTTTKDVKLDTRSVVSSYLPQVQITDADVLEERIFWFNFPKASSQRVAWLPHCHYRVHVDRNSVSFATRKTVHKRRAPCFPRDQCSEANTSTHGFFLFAILCKDPRIAIVKQAS